MADLSPILIQEITRIINTKSPLADKPQGVSGVSYVGGTLPDRITHIIAFHVEGWGLHRWASFAYVIAGPDPLNMEVRNIVYREDLTMPGADPWDDEDLTALAAKLLYV
ncbi:hypothetical protein HOU02_gp393 [Caulobacter phage CcrBL9]|uniref:Uncharacterized protein n=1 Tax=Caulobacter phage CcrBL9 TaxID=2283270 RepID=A0A385EEP9_9CAUD|nr:hypothetical protein HOU02_gp393 [Caulobacter phage CcrBL9]AXQ69332.1 hypothetical protein CcrBL9_gp308 [Caulobacter phage CcrBL9]